MTGHEHHHELARSTHTPELNQIHELNIALTAAVTGPGRTVTAEALGMTGQPVEGAGSATAPHGLPGSAVLVHLTAEGPPDFPYIEGRFRPTGGPGGAVALLRADMHTAALRRLSQALHLHHIWGA